MERHRPRTEPPRGQPRRSDRRRVLFQSDWGLQIFPDDPTRVRFADGSYISRARMPGGRPAAGHLTAAPDFVFEVVSPNDLASELDRKVHEYLEAGVPLVWVIHPDTRSAQVFRKDAPVDVIIAGGTLDGGAVLPGFACALADLFAAADVR
ncbi:MAG: Uma2 family endonuclease [Tepidiformaceae bacterium]